MPHTKRLVDTAILVLVPLVWIAGWSTAPGAMEVCKNLDAQVARSHLVGLVHGINIIWNTIRSMLDPNVRIYEIHNNSQYDAVFCLGVIGNFMCLRLMLDKLTSFAGRNS